MELDRPPACRDVGGIRWCHHPANCGVACDGVCAAHGLRSMVNAAGWLAAQDTAAECRDIGTAFGLVVAPNMGSYTYACVEDSGNHVGPAPVGGTWYCSTYNNCPTEHRTRMDGLGNACGPNTWVSICPCE